MKEICKNVTRIMILSVPGKVHNKVILDRQKTGVGAKLRDHQAGFRKDRSCIDQIATLQIIVGQSMEWYSFLYINFVNYEKAFDSLADIRCGNFYSTTGYRINIYF